MSEGDISLFYFHFIGKTTERSPFPLFGREPGLSGCQVKHGIGAYSLGLSVFRGGRAGGRGGIMLAWDGTWPRQAQPLT